MSSFTLLPRPPFRLDLAAWVLRRRPENTIDTWDGTTYRRVLAGRSRPLMLEVRQGSTLAAPRLDVALHCEAPWPEMRAEATAALQRLLGLRVDLTPFDDFAAQQPLLGPLARRFAGMKPPRYLSAFECLTNAIACQQVSLASGIQLLNRFADAFGGCSEIGNVRQHAFPRPEELAGVDVEALRELGFSRQKATAVLQLADHARRGEVTLESLARLSDQRVVERLCELRGIGRWSAEYALLRGLGRLHVFPGDDVGARNGLQQWLGLTDRLDYTSARQLLQRWQPYGGLIYFHMLLDKLAAAGHVHPTY
jgi:DNA-3-methyladenine glycosylase II